MKEIKIFEQAMHEDNEFFRTHQLNLTLFTAYRQQKHTGNELIDFSEVVWEDDIAAITSSSRRRANRGQIHARYTHSPRA